MNQFGFNFNIHFYKFKSLKKTLPIMHHAITKKIRKV